MNVVNFSDFKRTKEGVDLKKEGISLEELEDKLMALHQASKESGYDEISDLLALVMVATRDITTRECR